MQQVNLTKQDRKHINNLFCKRTAEFLLGHMYLHMVALLAAGRSNSPTSSLHRQLAETLNQGFQRAEQFTASVAWQAGRGRGGRCQKFNIWWQDIMRCMVETPSAWPSPEGRKGRDPRIAVQCVVPGLELSNCLRMYEYSILFMSTQQKP